VKWAVAATCLPVSTVALLAIACGSKLPPGLSEYVLPKDAGPDVPPVVLPVVARSDDPTTCDQAAMLRSYVGCDFWPTVVANAVWSIFDYAVVVANAGTTPADVTITGPMSVSATHTVAPNTLTKFYLPWVDTLKGPDSDTCGVPLPLAASVVAKGAAYHLTSSVPVTVYQFNALEYSAIGGPPGKNWSSCPGRQLCQEDPGNAFMLGCFSFTNDSSLLLPSTAMTGHYRVTGFPGSNAVAGDAGSWAGMNGYVAITGTVDGTNVKVQLPATAHVVAGDGIPDTPGGSVLSLTLGAGDVVELAGAVGSSVDLSGALVAADQPVQVIAGTPCSTVPDGTPACDHLEQSVFPAETLGKRYFVTSPTGPHRTSVSRVVRLYGNVDGTVLTYLPTMPAGCPATLDAGQVGDCGVVAGDFEVTGNYEFAVGTFQLGGTIVDPVTSAGGGLGDPSESLVASVEQFRTKYVFLAPSDYSENFIDLVAPIDAVMALDGVPLLWAGATPIADGYGVLRMSLAGIHPNWLGAHVLTASAPVGMQVIGYGMFTSYQYPGGLNLKQLAPPPPDPP
jgi:hypothetical protein